eukprot:3094478-Rhodomonas_salina.1
MVLQVAYPARVAGHDLDGGMSLRACCAKPGTDLVYQPVRACYAMPGTDLVYGATRPHHRSSLWTYGTTKRFCLRYQATRELCDA